SEERRVGKECALLCRSRPARTSLKYNASRNSYQDIPSACQQANFGADRRHHRLSYFRRSSDFFFFKQKTAYEITRRDWSSDVCSSDLTLPLPRRSAICAAVVSIREC